MLYQSVWARHQDTKQTSLHSRDARDDVTLQVASGVAGNDNDNGWSDPALRLIDEEANRMDVDPQVGLSSRLSKITHLTNHH